MLLPLTLNELEKELLQCTMRACHEYVRLTVVYMGNRIRVLSRASLDYVNLRYVAQQTLTMEASLNTHGVLTVGDTENYVSFRWVSDNLLIHTDPYICCVCVCVCTHKI